MRFEPWVVEESPEIWNSSPMKENDMAFQPMKYIQDITIRYTRDVALETRQFSEFPLVNLRVDGSFGHEMVGEMSQLL